MADRQPQESPKTARVPPGRRKAETIGALAGRVLEPALARRAGMNWQLLSSWAVIVGEPWATWTRPEKIRWPRRIAETDAFEPATLTVACEGARALEVQHEAATLVARVNAFFGFAAVDRLRIVQKPVAAALRRRPPGPTEADRAEALRRVAAIADPALRARLANLGAGILSRARRGKPG